VAGITAEIVARNGNYLFRRFHPFVAVEIIQSNARRYIIVLLCCQLKRKRAVSFFLKKCVPYKQALSKTFRVDMNSVILFCQAWYIDINVALFANLFQLLTSGIYD
jgi:hypothetical protein